MSNELIMILVSLICVFAWLQVACWNIGNRHYSMHYKSHLLIEKKGLCRLIYYKPLHFHRYSLWEVLYFFLSYVFLLGGLIIFIYGFFNDKVAHYGSIIMITIMLCSFFGEFFRIVYIDITYRREIKYRIDSSDIPIEDKVIKEIIKYAGTIRYSLDNLYNKRLVKIDNGSNKSIDDLDKEFIKYYRDYKKIIIDKNRVIYIKPMEL